VSLARDVRWRSARLGLAASVVVLASLLGAAPVGAADSITLTTPYPAVAVAPGANVSFDVSVGTTSGGRVDLALTGVPADWTASIRGGGFVVDGVETDGKTPTKVTLDVAVPAAAASGVQRLSIVARQASVATTLRLDIRVTPAAAGAVTLTTDTPQLKGASNSSFSFTLTLTNSTPDDLPFSVVATGPDGWTVTAQVGSQAQAASVVVKAGSSTPVTVSAKPSADAAAGSYPIAIDATSGNQSAHTDLAVEITGSYTMTLSTVNGLLNTSASAGSPTDLTLVLTNSGTADVEGAALSSTTPSGWKVTFDPPTVTVPANGSVQSVAHVTPSGDAIAGDYLTTFKATSPVATASADIRVSVETSLLWGAVGIALIAIVLIGLWWTFNRFGRR
jgi:uncharacterized membrane protein